MPNDRVYDMIGDTWEWCWDYAHTARRVNDLASIHRHRLACEYEDSHSDLPT